MKDWIKVSYDAWKVGNKKRKELYSKEDFERSKGAFKLEGKLYDVETSKLIDERDEYKYQYLVKGSIQEPVKKARRLVAESLTNPRLEAIVALENAPAFKRNQYNESEIIPNLGVIITKNMVPGKEQTRRMLKDRPWYNK